MQKNILNFFLLFLSIIIISLVIRHFTYAPEHQKSEQKATINDGFLEFYKRFHEDSIYQLQHIDFPLNGIEKSPDHVNHTYWLSDQWKPHKPISLPADYTQQFYITNDSIIDIIQDQSATFIMKRIFIKKEQDFELIYYEEMGPKM